MVRKIPPIVTKFFLVPYKGLSISYISGSGGLVVSHFLTVSDEGVVVVFSFLTLSDQGVFYFQFTDAC